MLDMNVAEHSSLYYSCAVMTVFSGCFCFLDSWVFPPFPPLVIYNERGFRFILSPLGISGFHQAHYQVIRLIAHIVNAKRLSLVANFGNRYRIDK